VAQTTRHLCYGTRTLADTVQHVSHPVLITAIDSMCSTT
jgi:hypothetical protein